MQGRVKEGTGPPITARLERASVSTRRDRGHRARASGVGSVCESVLGGSSVSGHIGDPPRPRASKFAVIRDSPITLEVGGDIDHTIDFDLGPNVWSAEPVVVSFLLIRAESLRLEVTMNDLSYTRGYSPGPERVIHEVIGAA